MNYGLYLSASGVLTNLYRQDVFANNLANVETVGFKRDLPSIRQRDPESIEDGFRPDVSQRLLDRLGGGVLAGAQRIDFSPGSLQRTSAPLDLSVDAPNEFLVVHDGNAAEGQSALRLTRDGRLSRNAEGYLVMIAGGHRVLGVNNQPIRISGDASLTIDHVGRIFQHGEKIAQIQVTGVTDKERLVKHGQNLLRFSEDQDLRQPPRLGTVKPGFVESSGVDPIQALMQLIASTKAVTSNGNLIRYHDLIMDRAVNVLGRVA